MVTGYWYSKYNKCQLSTKANFRNPWNVCFTNSSSSLTISDAMVLKLVTCFLFFFTPEAPSIFCIKYLRICHANLPREFAARLCRGYLPWEFAMTICRSYLPWGFLYIYASKSLLVYVSKSCLYGSKPFLYVRKTILFVRFSSSEMFLSIIVETVMGHRTIVLFCLILEFLIH